MVMCSKYLVATKYHSLKCLFCSECNILLAIHDLYDMNICLILKYMSNTQTRNTKLCLWLFLLLWNSMKSKESLWRKKPWDFSLVFVMTVDLSSLKTRFNQYIIRAVKKVELSQPAFYLRRRWSDDSLEKREVITLRDTWKNKEQV